MGIVMEKELSSGVVGNFWRAVSANLDLVNLKLHITIGLYLDEQKSIEGKDNLGIKRTYVFDVAPEEISNKLLDKMYEKILNNDPSLDKSEMNFIA